MVAFIVAFILLPMINSPFPADKITIGNSVVTDINGNPIIPDYSFKLQQCETSAYARIVENYFPETQWNSIPVSAVTNDCTAYVVKESMLASSLAKLS